MTRAPCETMFGVLVSTFASCGIVFRNFRGKCASNFNDEVLFDANYKLFASSFVSDKTGGYPGKPSGQKAVANIEAGNYDKTITFNFDKDGNVSIK